MAHTAVVSGLGRKRVASVLVRCFCKASLDCGEGEGESVRLHAGSDKHPCVSPCSKRGPQPTGFWAANSPPS